MSVDVSLGVLVSEGVEEAFIVTLVARGAHLWYFTLQSRYTNPHYNTSLLRQTIISVSLLQCGCGLAIGVVVWKMSTNGDRLEEIDGLLPPPLHSSADTCLSSSAFP